MTDQSSTVSWLRWVAPAEALSYVMLLLAVVAKHGFDQPGGVSLLGPIHGMLFLSYLGLVLLARDEVGWMPGKPSSRFLPRRFPLGRSPSSAG